MKQHNYKDGEWISNHQGLEMRAEEMLTTTESHKRAL